MLHSVKFGHIFDNLSQFVQEKHRKVFILADKNTFTYCYPLISALVPEANCIVLEAGEKYKTIQSCEKVWSFLSQKNADRNCVLLSLGGGVIGDLGGFCAATYKRGIASVLIPTTLLSMVDASIGGKTGIDFLHLKNQIGAFYLPELVLIDPTFLQTLPERELQAGLAEMWKHILITSEQKSLQLFDNTLDLLILNAIQESVNIKMGIVMLDPHENGARKKLNLGHTLGHAIESVYLEHEKSLLHGEAVFAGLWLEQFCAYQMNIFSENQWLLLSKALQSKLPRLDLQYYQNNILHNIKHDKKNVHDSVKFVLLTKFGDCVWDIEIPTNIINESINKYPK